MQMTDKTRAIVLHQVKYSDSGIIVQFYTRRYGRISVMIKGVRSKKKGKQIVFFQPMFILDLVMYYKGSREVQSLKEFSVIYTPSDIHGNIKKSSVAIFLGEVLTSVLREESPNVELFDIIEESVKFFDSTVSDYANFHLAFLAALCSYLGFEPARKQSMNDKYFDLQNGHFVSAPPVHGQYAASEISCVLADLFSSSFGGVRSITLTGSLRNVVLETLVKYYSLHLPGLKRIRSLEILKEVFG